MTTESDRLLTALVKHYAEHNDGMRPGEAGKAAGGISPQRAARLLEADPKRVTGCTVYRSRENVRGYGNFCGHRTEQHDGYCPHPQWMARELVRIRDALRSK
jgi:hypothetical protein